LGLRADRLERGVVELGGARQAAPLRFLGGALAAEIDRLGDVILPRKGPRRLPLDAAIELLLAGGPTAPDAPGAGGHQGVADADGLTVLVVSQGEIGEDVDESAAEGGLQRPALAEAVGVGGPEAAVGDGCGRIHDPDAL